MRAVGVQGLRLWLKAFRVFRVASFKVSGLQKPTFELWGQGSGCILPEPYMMAEPLQNTGNQPNGENQSTKLPTPA